jgi:hypothetical protein
MPQKVLNMRRMFKSALLVALMVAICAAPMSTHGATPVKSPATPPPHRERTHPSSSRHLPENPHLRNHTETKKRTAKPVSRSITARTANHRVRWPRHSASAAAGGTVTGLVVTSKGTAASGALVRLAKPGGRRIKNPHARHATVTGAAGTFSMHLVKMGRYRVVASRAGAGKGHSALAVRSTGVHRVDVKMGGVKVKKPKKRK